jgi:hypothetical protein
LHRLARRVLVGILKVRVVTSAAIADVGTIVASTEAAPASLSICEKIDNQM